MAVKTLKNIKAINAEETSDVSIISPDLEKKVGSIVNNTEVITIEETKQEEEVVIVKPVEEKVPERLVRVLMRENHRCYIGGVWYVLYKGTHYNVPENVKDILMKADLLQPL